MSTIISLDIGTVRIGCAVSDCQVKIPFPRATWNRAKGEAEREILNLIKELSPKLIVVGLPLNMAGERTPICDSVEQFCNRLMKRASIEIKYIDETLTSVEAEERMRGSNQEGPIDAVAACIILERYFEMERELLEQEL